MGLTALVIFGSALAQDAAQTPSVPFTFSLGMGYRVLSLESGIQQYVRRTNKVEGLDLTDSFSGSTFTLPYFTLSAGFEPHRYVPQIPEHLRFSADIEWSSSAVFGEGTDSENIDVSYYGLDIGDAETKWSHYLDDYTSVGFDVFYHTSSLHLWFLELRPGFGVRAQLSGVHNTSVIDMQLMNSKVLNLVGPDALEEDYGVYPNTTTYATVSGQGYSFYPYASLGLRLWGGYVVSNFGYRAEQVNLSVSEKTVSSDGENLGTDITAISLNASGFSAYVVLEIPFDARNIHFPFRLHPHVDPSIGRALVHFVDGQSPKN